MRKMTIIFAAILLLLGAVGSTAYAVSLCKACAGKNCNQVPGGTNVDPTGCYEVPDTAGQHVACVGGQRDPSPGGCVCVGDTCANFPSGKVTTGGCDAAVCPGF